MVDIRYNQKRQKDKNLDEIATSLLVTLFIFKIPCFVVFPIQIDATRRDIPCIVNCHCQRENNIL